MSRDQFEDHEFQSSAPEESLTSKGRDREPVFNIPGVVLALIVVYAGVHGIRTWFLSPLANTDLIYLFAFIPVAYGEFASQMPYPAAAIWSPVTYGFLHGDWGHVAMNCVWMAAFGTPLAIRFGAIRFVLFTIICMIAGAFAHYLAFIGEFVPVIGASGAVSGYMGAAGRFAFNNLRRGPGRGLRSDGPALSLAQSFANRQFLIFAGVWMVFNYLFGSGLVPISGQDTGIAWQAHVGGFFAGVLLFSLFDPVKVRVES